jgi:hypothetical protein
MLVAAFYAQTSLLFADIVGEYSVHDIDSLLRKIKSGARVRIVQDRYGQERIELRRDWLPLTKRIELSRDDLSKIKDALSARGRTNRQTATVTF